MLYCIDTKTSKLYAWDIKSDENTDRVPTEFVCVFFSDGYWSLTSKLDLEFMKGSEKFLSEQEAMKVTNGVSPISLCDRCEKIAVRKLKDQNENLPDFI